jgi:type VI secretion system secreted protein Hcp
MAQANYFLKIDGIKGQSEAKSHKDEIELESWNWGASNAGEGGGGLGHVAMNDLSITTKDGKATPLLVLSCATGKQIDSALLTCRQATGKQEDYLKIKLSNVFISSFQTGGGGGSDLYPTGQVTLNFKKIEFSQAPITDKGVGTFDTHWYDTATQDGK